jgi:hypothetical protein
MTKRRTVREDRYLVPGIFKVHKDALYGFIGHIANGTFECRLQICINPRITLFIVFCWHTLFLMRCACFPFLFILLFPLSHFLDATESSKQTQTVWCILYLVYGPVGCYPIFAARPTRFRRVFDMFSWSARGGVPYPFQQHFLGYLCAKFPVVVHHTSLDQKSKISKPRRRKGYIQSVRI